MNLKTVQYALFLLPLAALLIYIGYCFNYMLGTFHYLPQADDYRLTLYHIKPFLDGSWDAKMLWSDVHPNPIHGLILIGSAYFEQMSFASLPYLLFPFLLFKWLLIYTSLNTTTTDSVNPYFKQYAFIVFGFIIFSFNSIQQYLWNSVAIANIYHAMGALYILLIARFLKSSSLINLSLLLLFTTVFLICCRQFAAPWAYATLFSSFLLIVISKQHRSIGFKILLAIFIAIICESAFYKVMGIDLHYDSSSSSVITSIVNNWGSRLDELFLFSITELAMPIIYPWYLLRHSSVNSITLTTGIFIISIAYTYVFSISLVRLRSNLSYFIPILILIFVGVTIVATTVFRTNENTDWLINHIPRYSVFRNIAIMAMIWVLVISVELNKIVKWINYSLLLMLTATLAWTFNIHYQTEKAAAPYRVALQKDLQQELKFVYSEISKNSDLREDVIIERYKEEFKKEFKLQLGKPDTPSQRWKINVIELWGDNNLSIFRESTKTK